MAAGSAALTSFLARLLRRSDLIEAEQRAVLDLPTQYEHVRANRDFVRLGDAVDHSSIVFDGLVGRFDQTADGARQITAIHIAGDAPNLHSAALPKATSALQALTPSTILRVPHGALLSVAARFPAIAEAFWRDCAVDAAVLSQWVVNVGRRDARTRVAHLICELGTRFRVVRQGGAVTFTLACTQAHLADACGLTAVHINRTLRALRDEVGLVISKGSVHVADWARLAAIGDFDAHYLQEHLRPEERLRIAEPA